MEVIYSCFDQDCDFGNSKTQLAGAGEMFSGSDDSMWNWNIFTFKSVN